MGDSAAWEEIIVPDAEPITLSVVAGIAVIKLANPPVNALAATVRQAVAGTLQRLATEPDVRAIVLGAKGSNFCAGAYITEFGKPAVAPSLPDLIAAFDAIDKPIVAAIDGAALGGGLELALSCHSRIAGNAARLGLPEVTLGLLPGAGGTQRLPRLIGAAPALRMMTDGKPIPADAALQVGLVDALTEGDVTAAAVAHARSLIGQPLRRTRDLTARIGSREAFETAAAAVLAREAHNPAVGACVDMVRAAFDLPFEAALAEERACFLRLLRDDRSKALRYAFFAERHAARAPGPPAVAAPRPISRAVVVGGGTMGVGIAMCFANAGIPVTVTDTSEEAVQRGLTRAAETYAVSVKRGSLQAETRDARLALLRGKFGLAAAAEADIVIEAVFEEMDIKRAVFAELDRIARPGTVLATNTSFLNVDQIAAATGRPQDVLGLHFFSPANVMRLLEVVQGQHTAPDVLATAIQLGRTLQKVPVVVGVCRGFVGNRMLAVRSAEVEKLLMEGAQPEQIDAAITGFGFRMGPCAMGDLAGLDVGWRARRSVGIVAPVSDALCEAARFGQKTGLGFYRYEAGDRTPQTDPSVAVLISEISARHGVPRRAIAAEEIVERLTYPMINEGARILEEGIAARPSDIDVIWLNGYGWPAWRGGPMFHADIVGPARIAARLEELATMSGDETLRPAALLRTVATDGGFAGFAGVRP